MDARKLIVRFILETAAISIAAAFLIVLIHESSFSYLERVVEEQKSVLSSRLPKIEDIERIGGKMKAGVERMERASTVGTAVAVMSVTCIFLRFLMLLKKLTAEERGEKMEIKSGNVRRWDSRP